MAAILIVVGTLGGLYFGGWCMLVSPILGLCKAINAATAYMVGVTVVKCLLASFIVRLMLYVGLSSVCFIVD